MKLGTLIDDGIQKVVVRVDDETAAVVNYPNMEVLIQEGDRGLDRAHAAREDVLSGKRAAMNLTGANWLAPNPLCSKILGVAGNNPPFNEKLFRPMISPVFFLKVRSSLLGDGEAIVLRPRYGVVLPEPEVVAVFSRAAKNVSEDRILDHIFGYTITNDVTSRGIRESEDSFSWADAKPGAGTKTAEWRKKLGEDDIYQHATYHCRSKATDTFAPIGRWITTKDEIPDPNNLVIRGFVDGMKYCEGNHGENLFSVQRILSEASEWFTMEPGDCVHFGPPSRRQLNYPDGTTEVILNRHRSTAVEVDGLGRLENRIHIEDQ